LPFESKIEQEVSEPIPTRNVNLTEHYDNFIETSIAAGRFANASESC
jgi:hypothetical protein